MDIIGYLVTAGVGVIIYKAIDKIIATILFKWKPEVQLLKLITQIDNKYIDPLKKKYPQAGLELERKLARVLKQAADIIQDKV